jgi:hypothetical protein
MTKPKIYQRGKKLWVFFSVNGKQFRKSLKLDDTKKNRIIAETQIIPKLMIQVHDGEFFKKTKCSNS